MTHPLSGLAAIWQERGQGLVVAAKIRHQHLHAGPGPFAMNGLHGFSNQPGAAIRQIVPGHHGQDAKSQVHAAAGLGDPPGLSKVFLGGLFFGNRAKGATPGAIGAQQQKGCRAPTKALRFIGAVRLLADRV